MRAPSDGANVLDAAAVGTERRAWFTPGTLAAYLQVSERMVRKWVEQGRLRSYKIDGCRRFDPADVDVFVAQFREQRRPLR